MDSEFKFLAKVFGSVFGLLFLGIFGLCLIPVGCSYRYGVDGFGPVVTQTATVERLYVDNGGSSHYMVGTDKGVFEVSNGWLLGLWNADELYAKLEAGETYTITTKGNKVVGWFFQQYPYIIEVKPAEKKAE